MALILNPILHQKMMCPGLKQMDLVSELVLERVSEQQLACPNRLCWYCLQMLVPVVAQVVQAQQALEEVLPSHQCSHCP